jgi:D-glycero-alpha-D-manno-heptose-7-phosphate kinase
VCGRAPLRLSFCGGGSDRMPYAAEHGGIVVTTTVARHALARVRAIPNPVIRLRSWDYGLVLTYEVDDPLDFDGRLDLVKACIQRFRQAPGFHHSGLEVLLQTQAPPCTGLGGSSAVVVALISAFDLWLQLGLSRYEIADLAYRIEHLDVGNPGGLQDQYISTFGGFNVIEIHGEDDVVVRPLRLDPDLVTELERNSLLVYTGHPRTSADIVTSQVTRYQDGDEQVTSALDRMKGLTSDASAALLTGDITALGELLHEVWEFKKTSATAVTTPLIDRMYSEARRLGAIGGKLSGAGGGGFMYLICPTNRRRAVASRLGELGAVISPVTFEASGASAWMTPRHG